VPPTERLRRIVLALTAALIAAQPMITSFVGDGPPAPLAGLTLTLGWFAVFACWGVWQALVNPGRSIAGPIVAGLAATTGVIAARATWGTSNSWLSLLMAWRWAALPCVFLVVRQLTVDRDDARGMVAVLMATGAATMCVHIGPILAAPLGLDWPTEAIATQVLPDGYPTLTPTGSEAAGHAMRSWTGDAFWLALTAPAALALGLSVRPLPVRRVRLRAWPPLILILVGALVRCINAPPPAPPSWNVALLMTAATPGGVGPGLYDRIAGRTTPPVEEIVRPDPPNSYLGLSATAGWAALIVFLIALGIALREWRRPVPIDTAELPPFRPRWELQFGAIVGILGGMALQAYDWTAATAPPFFALAAAAGIRLVVWLIVYGFVEATLLAGLADRAFVWGLVLVTVCALAFDLLRPGLAEPYWAALAVTLNLRAPTPISAWTTTRPARWFALALGCGALGAFVWTAYVPAVWSIHAQHHFVGLVPHYTGKMELLRRSEGEVGKAAARGEASRFISRSILQPLIEATDHNRRDPLPPLLRVPWYVALAEMRGDARAEDLAIKTARAAAELDFDNAAPFLAEFLAHVRLAVLNRANRTAHFADAVDVIPDILQRDPALEARLHYQLATGYLAANLVNQAKSEATAARALDESAPSPRYHLTVAERRQIAGWLASAEQR
jgi:hypothetical protein